MTEDEGAMADGLVREGFSNQNEEETAMQGGGRIFQTAGTPNASLWEWE